MPQRAYEDLKRALEGLRAASEDLREKGLESFSGPKGQDGWTDGCMAQDIFPFEPLPCVKLLKLL